MDDAFAVSRMPEIGLPGSTWGKIEFDEMAWFRADPRAHSTVA
jgi:hypothetical protein